MSYIGAEPTTATFPFDQFSGNGSTTAFTLTYAPASTTSIIVAITGVVQNPNTYSVVGTTLNFSPAPPAGTNNISVLYLGLPVIGAPSPGNTAYFSSTSFTATASQTTFTPSGSYTPGFVNVIRNGSQLAPADYTATNGTTIVLANPCTAGDIVVTEVYTLTSLTNALPLTGGTVTGATTFSSNLTASGTTVFSGAVSGQIKQGTAVSASGTSVDFTGIVSTAKRITVMLSGVSTNGTSNILCQIGSGSISTSGYASGAWASNTTNSSSTAGFLLTGDNETGNNHRGHAVITLFNSNTYVQSGVLGQDVTASVSGAATVSGGTSPNLSGTLDRLRITTVNGTDTFDAGTINILVES